MPLQHDMRGRFEFLRMAHELSTGAAALLRRMALQCHAIDRKHLAADQPLPITDRDHRREHVRGLVADRTDELRDRRAVRRLIAAQRDERHVLGARPRDRPTTHDAARIREAIAGRKTAAQTAATLGVASWDERHDSDAFQRRASLYSGVVISSVAFWSRETFVISIDHGVDEVALALTADPYSRTYRSHVITVAADTGELRTKSGVRVLPDRPAAPQGLRERY